MHQKIQFSEHPKNRTNSKDSFEQGRAFGLKEQIKKDARADKRAKIDALWNLLISQYKNGNMDFTVTKIGQELEARGILKSQSYRNSGGQHFRDITEAFAQEVGGRTHHFRAPSVTPLDQVINSLPDIDAQARLRVIVREEAKLRLENQQLRALWKTTCSNGLPATAAPSASPSPAVTSLRPTENAKHRPWTQPLKQFLETDWLTASGLRCDADGTVYFEGQPITLPGFSTQLQEVIDYLENDDI